MIAPSILAADFSKLGEQVRDAAAAGADRIHIDVMDGHFVPNLSMGSVVCKGIRPITNLPLEVHLMVEDPWKFVEGFVNNGADSIIFHLEVSTDPIPVLRQIRETGKKVGLAFNPDYPVDRIAAYLSEIDIALCMTVFPGFGGQSFIPESLPRIRKLAGLIREHNPNCELEVDGGIDVRTIGDAARAGANVFVAGTAIYGAKNGISGAISDLKKAIKGTSG